MYEKSHVSVKVERGSTFTFARNRWYIGEIYNHVYGKRQTSDLSFESFKRDNEKLKIVPNNSYGQNWRETTNLFVEVMNSKRKGKEKLSHVVQIHFWPFDVNVTQNLLLLTQ